MAGSSSSAGPSTNFKVYNPGSSYDHGAPMVVINGTLANISDTAQHTLVSAQGPNLRSNLTFLSIANSSSTFALVTLTDGVSTLYLPAPGTSGAIVPITYAMPFVSQPNTAITIQSNAAANLYISCLGFQGP